MKTISKHPTPKTAARRKAIALGLSRYRDGRICKNGHVNPERLTSCARCVACHRDTKRSQARSAALGKKMRIARFGFDRFDLRCRRKERHLTPSDKKHLVALRKKRKLFGRKDRPSIEGEPKSL